MRHDSRMMRGEKPFVMTNCCTGEGIEELLGLIGRMVLFNTDKP
jgi:urease accessory protein